MEHSLSSPGWTELSQSPVLRYVRTPRFLRNLLLIGLTLAALGGVWNHQYVNYDDPGYVQGKPEVENGLSGANITWAFTTWSLANWHPLTWLSLQLDATLFGPTPEVFHRTNLILHLVNVLLLAEVLRRMTGALWRSAVVAALFAVHPLHVESVAWISERKDLLSTLFGLLALAAYVAYARRPRLLWMGAVLLAYAASLMAKPMLVTLPFLLLLLDYWPLRRLAWNVSPGSEDPRSESLPAFAPARPVWLVVEKAPLFLLSAGSCVMTVLSQAEGGAIAPLQQMPLDLRLANAVDSVVCYIGQMFYPAHLAVFYPYPRAGLPWVPVLFEALLLAGITVAICWLARSRPYLLVGWFWYLGTLMPVIGLVQVGVQARADRYTYIPLIGLFLLLAWGVHDLIPQRKWFLAGQTAAPLLVCILLTRTQVAHWADSVHLWEHTVAVTKDNPRARANYAIALVKQGELEKALPQVKEAIRLAPRLADAHYVLGRILDHLGRWEEAEICYRQALALNPDEGKYRGALLDLLEKRKMLQPQRPKPRSL